MKKGIWAILVAATLWTACGRTDGNTDQALRVRVDGLNREAFVNRYRDIVYSIDCACKALALVDDSLPAYEDGRLRAFNNLAYGFYMLDMTDSAHAYLDSVAAAQPAAAGNAEVEHTIADLIRIRLLQRECRLAESIGLLHDVGDVGSLHHMRQLSEENHYLYDFARMEYYITSLTLNYHYRNDAVASSSGTELTPETRRQMQQLLDRVERDRSTFRCDDSEDLALDYAIAHSHYRLAAVSPDHLPHLLRAFQYIDQSQRRIDNPSHYCHYHQANLYQLKAFIGADTSWFDDLPRLLAECPDLVVDTAEVLALFRQSTDMFFETPDPYQHLGAIAAAAEYCLRVGDTAQAGEYYMMALNDTSWRDGIAPKFESMLYDGLIRSGCIGTDTDRMAWYARQVALLSFISQNERADILLQRRLETSQQRNRLYGWATGVGAAFLVLLAALVLMLRRRSRHLRRETQALQEAQRRDIERIANVETCLSVLRHDINPFLSYLQNKNLSPEMRQEVLDQLLRTFSNIKSWTNLSIPTGLQFRPQHFPFDEVAAAVCAQSLHPDQETVLLEAVPSGLLLWGDRDLTEILLRNLVSNAMRHTHSGSVTLSAEADPDDPRMALITVSDTGEGMDAETLESLFRADKSLPDGGHGFGLILCRYIIKLHDDNTIRGCRIWAESTPGHGTVMHIRLSQPQKP